MKQLEAKDLRIGNYVNVLGDTKILRGISQYNQKHRTQTVVHYFEFDETIPLKDIHLKPIPITEEWLIRFGFTEQIGFIKFIGEDFVDDSFEVAHNDLDKWYCYYRNFNKGKVDDFVLLRNDLKYIHQLQNLYFALTGVELELKQPQNNNT